MRDKTEQNWPILLFSKSVLKQRKYKEVTDFLGDTKGLHCLDIGSDNGVISYLLRKRGGTWKSADLDEHTVTSIRGLVKDNVFQINGRQTPFADNEFDRVAIVDFLEHIETDEEFAKELFRIIKPGGELVINVPHIKNSLLRKFRLAIGQTDEKHGHVRPGYTVDDLVSLLMGKFKLVTHRTYSKFFSEGIDTLMTLALDLLKRGGETSQKGRIVTGKDMKRYQKMFGIYSLIYPVVWFASKLDTLLVGASGYMLIVKAKIDKEPTR
ncbi:MULTISPECIES: class I SAM-dependent methyltransferase [unclassified Coleofasciculus]|uniref:class I SAM-dependent methyltransferase n=1 Tax=unclassified Coleofasciculus TaxID=2692782 RepID=UPI001881DB53|nr:MULTISPECIES: class I SAM-dependent methyltransferase [unclassified Coleofasciculus]MBE9126150.1 class I SAM-dependent methyltransferase [Coleofasciculus sp. LEGE 07081]MBE9149568.1 class I SAM-dependent methyltransferase [Coleofasciculus sp. LEGE 07092]